MRKIRKNAGFTLIEAILYLGLFSIIIGGGMISVYGIIQSTDSGSNHIILQEEANFLLRKINWALTGATSVIVTSSPPTLSVTKTGFPTLVFDLDSSSLRLTRGAGPATLLNSTDVRVSNLSFIKTTGGGKPDVILASFTLTTFQNGKNVTQDFSTTKYLRK